MIKKIPKEIEAKALAKTLPKLASLARENIENRMLDLIDLLTRISKSDMSQLSKKGMKKLTKLYDKLETLPHDVLKLRREFAEFYEKYILKIKIK